MQRGRNAHFLRADLTWAMTFAILAFFAAVLSFLALSHLRPLESV
jgi:hypothetical protein